MRALYVVLTYLLAPVVIAMEGWKALWNPEYRGRLGQRLGFIAPPPAPGSLWLHAVSPASPPLGSGPPTVGP